MTHDDSLLICLIFTFFFLLARVVVRLSVPNILSDSSLDFFFLINIERLQQKDFYLDLFYRCLRKFVLHATEEVSSREQAAEGSPRSSGAPGSSPRLLRTGASGRGALCGTEAEVQTPPLLSAPSPSLSVGFSNSRPAPLP